MKLPSDIPNAVEIDQQTALSQIAEGVLLVDIRSSTECLAGSIKGANILEGSDLLDFLASFGAKPEQPVMLCCSTGKRSLQAVATLHNAGFANARSITGGYQDWADAGLPTTTPSGLQGSQPERYARHLVLDEIGPAGQVALLGSRVLLVGAGGLGSPAALYLAAAGVGTLGIVDDDRVERSNLQRQILHEDSGVGELKTRSAAQRLKALNPDIAIEEFEARLDETNAVSLLSGWHLVIDGSDNLSTRYQVNNACVTLNIPLVYGAVSGFEGQVGVLHPARRPGRHACYNCLFPQSVQVGEVQDCNTGGVLGVVPGVIGLLQATEAIKYLLGLGQPLVDRMLLWDALAMEFREIRVTADPECAVCSAASAGQ